MELTFESHPPSEDFDDYAMGTVSPTRLEAFEEHLLVCDGCRFRLDETEEDLRVLRIVLRAYDANLPIH